jgi:hypothetical protein
LLTPHALFAVCCGFARVACPSPTVFRLPVWRKVSEDNSLSAPSAREHPIGVWGDDRRGSNGHAETMKAAVLRVRHDLEVVRRVVPSVAVNVVNDDISSFGLTAGEQPMLVNPSAVTLQSNVSVHLGCSERQPVSARVAKRNGRRMFCCDGRDSIGNSLQRQAGTAEFFSSNSSGSICRASARRSTVAKLGLHDPVSYSWYVT